MANSVNYQKTLDGKIAINPGLCNSVLKVWSDTFEASSTAANTVIDICKMPKGAVIHQVIAVNDALGSSVTFDVGDSNDVDRYLDGAGGSNAATTNTTMNIAGVSYTIGTNSGDDVIQAKILGGSATGTIQFLIYYAV